MEKDKKTFFWISGGMVVLGLVIVFSVGTFFSILVSTGNEQSSKVTFVLHKGEGVNQVSERLFESGLIKNKFVFETSIWLFQSEGRLVAGEYEIPQNMSIIGLISRLLRGPEKPPDRSITIIEGWGRGEIAEYLEKEGFKSSDEFLEKSQGFEGYLFPDTYRVFPDASGEEIIEKFLNNFHKKVNEELLQEIRRQGKTLHEVLSMASLVEAEVQTLEDRKNVADIFWKRLQAQIPLQSDATINFLTRSGRSRSTLVDLEIDSPYNTYKYAGLPPGPINNPSLQAIMAAVFPQANPYYYFLTDNDGNVYYARNQGEHNMNRERYLK